MDVRGAGHIQSVSYLACFQVTWRSEDDWMDEYRDAASRSPQASHERLGALTAQDEALLQVHAHM